MPAMGLAFAVTVVSSYVPVLLGAIAGPVVVGAFIGGEGFFGLFMPTVVGGLLDRSTQAVRGRLIYIAIFGVAITGSLAALAVLGFVDAFNLWSAGLILAVLYAAYYAYLTPYWALYTDLVPKNQSGRSRSVESTWRVTGVGGALIGGGLLLDLSPGWPFFAGAVLAAAVTLALLGRLRSRRGEPIGQHANESRAQPNTTREAIGELLRNGPIRNLFIANALWNGALSALRAFVVLFFVVGMGTSATYVSTVIFPLVAVGIIIGAPISGWLADRIGHIGLVTATLCIYGTVIAFPGFTQATWVVALIPVVALSAATLMTLPESMLMRLVPAHLHGSASGLFGLSRGIGGVIGPVATGVAILVLRPVLSTTHGYAAMWFVCSLTLLISIPFVLALRHDERL